MDALNCHMQLNSPNVSEAVKLAPNYCSVTCPELLLFPLRVGLTTHLSYKNIMEMQFIMHIGVFHSRVLAFRGHLALSEDIFGCHNSGGECCYWIWWVEVRDAAKTQGVSPSQQRMI